MKIYCSLKVILIILIGIFFTVNIIFGILYLFNNNTIEIKDDEMKLKERVEYMKKNFNFNNTFYMNGNDIHFYYGTNNSNIPKY